MIWDGQMEPSGAFWTQQSLAGMLVRIAASPARSACSAPLCSAPSALAVELPAMTVGGVGFCEQLPAWALVLKIGTVATVAPMWHMHACVADTAAQALSNPSQDYWQP